MAFTTGPDFLSGILGASNSTDVLNKFKSDTGQEDFYQGLRNRYGERIGDDGYLRSGIGTADFIDSDRDGIDDRHQAGPGQPRAGSNPDGSPIFGGGGDNPNSPMNNRPVADYNPNLVGQYVGYNNPEYGMGLTYNNSSNVDPANETGFLEGFDIKNFLPGSFIAKGLAKGLGALEKNFFPETLKANLDKLTPEAFKERYGDFMDKYGTEQAPQDIDYDFNDEAIKSFLDRYQKNPSYSDIGLEYADDIRTKKANIYSNLTDVDPTLAKQLDPTLSLANYENTAMNMTDQYNTAIQQQAEREAREAQAEQDRINNAVASGDYVGTGFDPVTGNYGGLLTNTNSNSGTSVTSNVQTGPYSGAALSGAIQNENFNNMMANRRERNNQSGQNDGNESQSQGQHAGSGHRLGR